MLVLLPPSEGKAVPVDGRALDLTRLSFPTLSGRRAELVDDAIRSRPARPAREIYTGVLYQALDLATIPARVQRRVVIVSAQYGAVRPADPIAPYRRVIDAPGWRPLLGPELARAAGRGAILDCRSAAYAAAWRPEGAQAERWAHVAVVRERDGVRTVVSHDAKRTRGELARHVLLHGGSPRTVHDLAAIAATAFVVELDPPGAAGRPWRLTVVTR
ncbi:MAG: YaaA family protein [Gaiellales bacterium]